MSDSLFPANRSRGRDAGLPLPGAGAKIPADAVRRPRRPGADGAHARQFLRREPHPPSLYSHGRARGRQDDDGAHSGARLQLCPAGQDRPPEHRHARTRRALPGDHGIAPCRCDRDGRGLPHRHRRRARDHRERALSPGFGAHQGLHHRRSAHALEAGLQRSSENARGAAGARQVSVRDHRNRKSSDHRALALHSLRFAAHRGGADGRPFEQDLRS